jgi:MFS family permease
LLGALIIQFVAAKPRSAQAKDQPSVPLRQVAASLAKDKSMMGLAAALFIVWFTGTGRVQFESIYLVQLGASESIVGLATSFGALVELPFMLWSDRLVHRHGAGAVLRAALLLQAAGMVAIVAAPSVASIFVFRAVQGVAYSMLTVSLVSYIIEGAPHGQDATALTFYDVTLHGLVILVASPLSGMFFDLAGAYWLYAIALAGNLIGWLILSVTARPPRVTRDASLSSS